MADIEKIEPKSESGIEILDTPNQLGIAKQSLTGAGRSPQAVAEQRREAIDKKF